MACSSGRRSLLPKETFFLEDIKVGVEGGSKFVELHIRKSKTDQRGQGAQVNYHHMYLDRRHPHCGLCTSLAEL